MSKKQRYKGKTVVVTGASAGIGRAIVRAFGAQGANLGLIARNVEGLEAAAQEVREYGGEALVLPADVADAAAVERAAAQVVDRFGGIDIWINDAMVTVFAPVWKMTPDEYRRVTEVTYLGYVYGTMAALQHMRQRNEGVIIQIGSALAYRSIPLQSAYCGSKAAIRGFTDSIRSELIHEKSNIKLSHLLLPAVNTPQFDIQRAKLDKHPQPVPPIFQPEVIAEATLWAAEHHPREMLIGFSTIKAVIGQRVISTLFPGMLDRYLAKAAWKGQMTNIPIDPNRPDNLYDSVPGDHGAHGSFDGRSRTWSPELELRTHAGAVAAAAAVFAALGGLAVSLIRRD